MPTSDPLGPTDAAELQTVLTRYVDSHDGYLQAAEVVDSPNLATAFREIAARRAIIVEHVATLIVEEGATPDEEGSPEAAIHRWWIRVRATMTDEEFKATLAECVRGEKELARTIDEVLEHGNLEATHAAIVAEVAAELKEALQTFEMVLER